MHRFVIFVDGSNFAGVLRRLSLRSRGCPDSGPPQLSRVRMSADFVVQVSENELIERGLAKKAVRHSSTASAPVSMPRQQ